VHHRRFARGPTLHHELKEAHATAMVRLRAVDAELQELLVDRRSCLDELEGLRSRVDRRYGTRHGGRRRPLVDEPPVPPTPPDALPLFGTDLRAVAIRLLRRHGAHRLRDLHGLLHCYGYAVAGPHPVKDLADAMGYEVRCGRARRVARGVYEAEPHGDDVPYPRWLGAQPEDRLPLPWSEPVTEPGPPLVDPPVAEDPVLWSGGGYPDPPAPGPDRPAEPTSAPPAPPALPDGIGPHPEPPPDGVGSDSVPNRTPRGHGEVCPPGEESTAEGDVGIGSGEEPDEPP